MAEPRATGIGGVFFKANNPATLARWYSDHLGIPLESGAPDEATREPSAQSFTGKRRTRRWTAPRSGRCSLETRATSVTAT